MIAEASAQFIGPDSWPTEIAAQKMYAVPSRTPASSFAAHDAEVGAKALEYAAKEFENHGYVAGLHTEGYFGIGKWEGEPDEWLRALADALRTQGTTNQEADTHTTGERTTDV